MLLKRKCRLVDLVERRKKAMYEDKQMICDKLLITLRYTSHLYDLLRLTYDDEKEIVTAMFDNGYEKRVNVHMDSGYAMIQDIIDALR